MHDNDKYMPYLLLFLVADIAGLSVLWAFSTSPAIASGIAIGIAILSLAVAVNALRYMKPHVQLILVAVAILIGAATAIRCYNIGEKASNAKKKLEDIAELNKRLAAGGKVEEGDKEKVFSLNEQMELAKAQASGDKDQVKKVLETIRSNAIDEEKAAPAKDQEERRIQALQVAKEMLDSAKKWNAAEVVAARKKFEALVKDSGAIVGYFATEDESLAAAEAVILAPRTAASAKGRAATEMASGTGTARSKAEPAPECPLVFKWLAGIVVACVVIAFVTGICSDPSPAAPNSNSDSVWPLVAMYLWWTRR